MRIAIFHNFMDNIGGAEMVALALVRGLDADLYTTNIDEDKIIKMGYADIVGRIKSIGTVPVNAPFRHQMALWKFRRLNLGTQYDFYIIAGDWAMSGAVQNKPNLWYAHSPLNELWQFKSYIKKEVLSWWKKPIFEVWVWLNRRLTLRYAKHVGMWVCNSQNTKNRIHTFYNKNATVIYPPVDISQYEYRPAKNYWLSVNRLVKHKRIDMQMKAFAKLPDENLVIVGSFEKGARQFEGYKKYIESIKPANVEILHWVDDVRLRKLYSECKGFIATAQDEDFGMTSVEAMACGKPVIAAREGGYKESVVDGETGILIDHIHEDKLVHAVEMVGTSLSKYKDLCIERAALFDKKVFLRDIKKLMQ